MPFPPILLEGGERKVVQSELEILLAPFASKHCIERGLNKIQILDKDIVEGYGFYTVKGTEEGSTPHATKIFPDGTIYCSCEGTRFNSLIAKKKLCSHLVASIADMYRSGVDIKEILKQLAFGSGERAVHNQT